MKIIHFAIKTKSFSIFRYLSGFVFKYKVILCIALVSIVAGSLIVLSLPWILRILVNSIFGYPDKSRLNLATLLFFILLGLESILIFIQNYVFSYLANRIVADIRADLFSHIIRMPLGFFNTRRLGEILSRVTSDITVIQYSLTTVPVNMVRHIITIVGGIILMLVLEWRLAMITFISFPLIGLSAAVFRRKLKSLSTVVQDKSAAMTAVLEDALSGVREVKLFNGENAEEKRFKDRIEDRFLSLVSQGRQFSLFISVETMLAFIVIIFVLWIGGRLAIDGAVTPGDLIAILIYMGVIAGTFVEAACQYSRLQEAAGASERLCEIKEMYGENRDFTNAVGFPEIKNGISFQNVTFSYDEGAKKILNNISFFLKKGEKAAIVGRSGSGKTTLASLLPRLFDPQEGIIEIDDIDIKKIRLEDLRKNIAVVSQETFLFGVSVRENIAYGKPCASEKEIIEAAKTAFAHDFILELPEKYETLLGDRGVNLSAGQKQRIAIARAVLKKPAIIILDEATTSLDNESEKLVDSALENLMEKRIALIITHRIPLPYRMNKIITLKDRGITIDELI